MVSKPKPKPQHTFRYRRVSEQLRQWREEAHLSQRELGRRLGRLHTWVHKCETGDRRVDPVEWLDWFLACGIEPMSALKSIPRQAK